MGSPSLSNGTLTPWSNWGKFNQYAFIIAQAISKLQTSALVRIEAVKPLGEDGTVGSVDVLPLVDQIDGNGNSTPHTTIFNLPYLRYQGGTSAIILDPQVGDIGVALFASRDISVVKRTRKQAAPGSLRQYNFCDGMYLGGLLNAPPEQYVEFSDEGIKLHTTQKVIIESETVEISGDVTIGGGLIVTNDVVANHVSLHDHIHPISGGNPTGPPTPTP